MLALGVNGSTTFYYIIMDGPWPVGHLNELSFATKLAALAYNCSDMREFARVGKGGSYDVGKM